MRADSKARLSNILGKVIHTRLLQIVDNAVLSYDQKKEHKDAKSPELITKRVMFTVQKKWLSEDWDDEVKDLLKNAPTAKSLLTNYLMSSYTVLYGITLYKDDVNIDDVIRNLIFDTYQQAVAYFQKFPAPLLANTKSDPTGNVYKSGEKRLIALVNEELLHLVPTPVTADLPARAAPSPASEEKEKKPNDEIPATISEPVAPVEKKKKPARVAWE